MSIPVSEKEALRLQYLNDFGLLDAVDFPGMSRITELAAAMCDAPFATITIVGETETQLRATVGIESGTIERAHTVCNYTILGDAPFTVRDFRTDARFSSSPYVTGGPRFRAYAGVPVPMETGYHAGSLCVLDDKPRQFTAKQLSSLQALAELASQAFRHTDKENRLAASLEEIRRTQNELILAKEKLTMQKRLLDEATSLASMGAFDYDTATDTMIWSDSMYAMHGLEPGVAPSVADMADRMTDEDRQHFQTKVLPQLAKGIPADIELKQRLDGGEWRWFRLRIHPVMKNGRQVRRYGVKQDITEQKKLLDHVSYLASHDQLTNIINRHELSRRFPDFVRRAQGAGARIGVAMLDLDGFKEVNDTLGHEAGDECLRVIASRLRNACGNDCEIARYGGDEFQLLYRVSRGSNEINEMFEQIVQVIGKPIKWRSNSLEVTASLGFHDVDAFDGCKLEELQQCADLAVIEAKSAGKNCIRRYSPLMRVETNRRATVIRSITEAIRSDQLMLFYQPQFDSATGLSYGFEALLRWTTRDGRILAPGAFAEALADPRLARRIDELVLDQAMVQAAQWKQAGRKTHCIAINLTRSTLNRERLADWLLECLKEKRLEPSDITVELTENVILSRNADQVKSNLQDLHDSGILIYLDDFGTGYASLSHLRSLPFHGIKIDKSFVASIAESQADRALIRNIAELACSLGKDVIIEGIETPDQLAQLGSDLSPILQGYLFCEPMSVAALDERWTEDGFIRSSHPLTHRPVIRAITG